MSPIAEAEREDSAILALIDAAAPVRARTKRRAPPVEELLARMDGVLRPEVAARCASRSDDRVLEVVLRGLAEADSAKDAEALANDLSAILGLPDRARILRTQR